MVLQPQRGFQVQVVGGFVQQQQVRLWEEGGGQRDAHSPTAGKLFDRQGLLFGEKAEAGQNGGGTGRGGMGVDGQQAFVDFGDAQAGVWRFPQIGHFVQQGFALGVGVEHPVEQTFFAVRGVLRHLAHARPWPHRDTARVRLRLAANQAEQGVLPLPLRPTKPTRCPAATCSVVPSKWFRPKGRGGRCGRSVR